MTKLPSRFRRLDQILADLPVDDPMLLSELDGYLACIAVHPVSIAIAEWLPPIWGGAYGEGAPFEDPIDVRLFADMVAARRDEILRTLLRGKFQPIFDVDQRTGEPIWEEWVLGFALAMDLQPDAWRDLAEADETAAAAVGDLSTLADVAGDHSSLTADEINAFCDAAPSLVPQMVHTLSAFRAREPAEPASGQVPSKIGRNDPCHCGSGKETQALLWLELIASYPRLPERSPTNKRPQAGWGASGRKPHATESTWRKRLRSTARR
jgi:uncharacterized protein